MARRAIRGEVEDIMRRIIRLVVIVEMTAYACVRGVVVVAIVTSGTLVGDRCVRAVEGIILVMDIE